jgi:trans-aconitate 2-methyltransferase
MPWDPNQYHLFQKERAAPFTDLLDLIRVRPGMQVVDLGCGTGELTRRLAEHLPGSQVLGLDSSKEMLDQAATHARAGLRFQWGRIEALEGEWDLVFSHAALQWVEDHRALIPSLLDRLRPGGQLAAQMPSNHTHPAQTLILEVAGEPPFVEALEGWMRRSPVLSIDAYAELLFASGAQELAVFEKVYPHVLEGADAVAEWGAGTVLVPYYERLPAELHAPFMARYKQRLREHWPEAPVFYGFRRTFLAASWPG